MSATESWNTRRSSKPRSGEPGAISTDQQRFWYVCLPAGFWLRFFAYLIDNAILLIALQLAGCVLALNGLVFVATNTVYHAIFESSPFHASPGKIAFRLYVVTSAGAPCSFLRAFSRNLLKILSDLLGVGYIVAAFSLNKQALHDMLSATLVVRHEDLELRQLIPSIFFGASLHVLFITWVIVLYSEGRLPEVPQFERPAVPATVSAAPTAAPVMPPEGIGYVQVGAHQSDFQAVFVRLQKPMLRTAGFDARRYPGSPQLLEAAFFSADLSEDERKVLQEVPSLTENAVQAIGKIPELVVQLVVPESQVECNGSLLHDGFILVNADGFKRLKFSPETAYHHGLFSFNCPTLAAGSKLYFVLVGDDQTEGGQKISWNLRFEDKLAVMHVLPRVTLDDYADALALWHAKSGLLEIGFFSAALSPAQTAEIGRKGSLSAAAASQPMIVAALPMAGGMLRANADSVSHGYSITVHTADARLRLPTTQGDFVLQFPTGTFPEGLSATLLAGHRVQGRFEGQRIITLPEGNRELGWLLTFNAPLVVAQ